MCVIILECVNESLQGSATVLHYKYVYCVWAATYTILYSYCKLMFEATQQSLSLNSEHWPVFNYYKLYTLSMRLAYGIPDDN